MYRMDLCISSGFVYLILFQQNRCCRFLLFIKLIFWNQMSWESCQVTVGIIHMRERICSTIALFVCWFQNTISRYSSWNKIMLKIYITASRSVKCPISQEGGVILKKMPFQNRHNKTEVAPLNFASCSKKCWNNMNLAKLSKCMYWEVIWFSAVKPGDFEFQSHLMPDIS